MYHGIINVYKEAGFTSHDVVAKCRGIFGQKKIGHTGTLDPDAVGVLPVCLGSATRLCDMLTDETKEYVAVFKLGVVTDTQDLSGTILSKQDVHVTEEQVREVISHYVGEQMQIPPMYSALKVNGQKLYELARAGKEVERLARPITIHQLEIRNMNLPEVEIRVECSKGTYIRTLCHDIGAELGCGAAMKSLIRSRVGRFRVEESVTLEQLQAVFAPERSTPELVQKWGEAFEKADLMIAPDAMFEQYQAVTVPGTLNKALENGNQLPLGMLSEALRGDFFRIYHENGKFYGIYQRDDAHPVLLKPFKMFMTE